MRQKIHFFHLYLQIGDPINLVQYTLKETFFLFTGILSSSEDEGDSYSSDGEGSLVIDANAHSGEVNQNGHSVEQLGYTNSPDAERQ